MITSTIRALALSSLIATLTPLGLMAQEPARFVVPFAFTVGRQSFSPGTYRVKVVMPQVLALGSTTTGSNIFIPTYPDTPSKVNSAATLTFRRYGSRYFLANMADSLHGYKMPISVQEKELIATRNSAVPLDILANARK